MKALHSAEKILAADPTSASALKLLAEAAMALDLPETAAFAREAAFEHEPDDAGNLLQLGEAWLAAGRPQDALRTADTLLKLKPLDSAAQNLMRKAAIAKTSRESGWDGLTTAIKAKDGAAKGSTPAPGTPAAANAEELRHELVDAIGQVAIEPEQLDHYRTIVERYRSLGQPDFYPFVLTARVITKIDFVLRLIVSAQKEQEAAQPPESAAPPMAAAGASG